MLVPMCEQPVCRLMRGVRDAQSAREEAVACQNAAARQRELAAAAAEEVSLWSHERGGRVNATAAKRGVEFPENKAQRWA